MSEFTNQESEQSFAPASVSDEVASEVSCETNAEIGSEKGDEIGSETGETPDEAGRVDSDPSVLLAALVAERTEDLKRIQAEYMNYKKRVDRDRALARGKGVESVLLELLPVLDAVAAAEEHEDNADGLKLIAAELKRIAQRFGLVSFGEPGEQFDPHHHEALMQIPDPETDIMKIAQVIQPGFQLNEVVIRPARVAVAVPVADDTEEDAE